MCSSCGSKISNLPLSQYGCNGSVGIRLHGESNYLTIPIDLKYSEGWEGKAVCVWGGGGGGGGGGGEGAKSI